MEGAKFALWGNKFLNFTKEIGTKIADGAVYAAKKTKEGAIFVGQRTKEGAIFVGNKTKEGAIFVGNKTKEGAHFIAEKAKPATDKIKKAFTKKGDNADVENKVVMGDEIINNDQMGEDPK